MKLAVRTRDYIDAYARLPLPPWVAGYFKLDILRSNDHTLAEGVS
jgi:hypothetical protein